MQSLAIRYSLAALAFALASPSPAQANDGRLCDGIVMVVCAPLALAGTAASLLTPKTPGQLLMRAIQEGDVNAVKRLAAQPDTGVSQERMLATAVRFYLENPAASNVEDRLNVFKYLMDTAGDIRGAAGVETLKQVVNYYQVSRNGGAELAWPGRLILARLLLDRGVSASEVDLKYCTRCEENSEFQELMLAHGARPKSSPR